MVRLIDRYRIAVGLCCHWRWPLGDAFLQRWVVDEQAPGRAIGAGGEIEGCTIARYHAAAFLLIEQRPPCPMSRYQIVQIDPHQCAAAAALTPDMDVAFPHGADGRQHGRPEGVECCGHFQDDSPPPRPRSSVVSDQATCRAWQATEQRVIILSGRCRGAVRRKPVAGLLHWRCDPAGAPACFAPARRSVLKDPDRRGL